MKENRPFDNGWKIFKIQRERGTRATRQPVIDDLGLVETDGSNCKDGEVGSYLSGVQLDDQDPSFSEEEALMLDTIPVPGKSTSIAFLVQIDLVSLR